MADLVGKGKSMLKDNHPNSWATASLRFLWLSGKGILLPNKAGPWRVLLPTKSDQLYNPGTEKAENVEKYCVSSTQSPAWFSPFIPVA